MHWMGRCTTPHLEESHHGSEKEGQEEGQGKEEEEEVGLL
jgi:hypothetical protein